jgi:hypothetical protein
MDPIENGRETLQLDSGNMRPKDKGMSKDSYPVVREDDTCPHWTFTGGDSLAPMRECWYCKYSDFRKDISEHRAQSVCRRPTKSSD